ncbi:hypothetical protein GUJ93_ZPchr0002g26802 [Zizania palustris]|uniref:Uncharacterized protein n=1 Tax=Zizania palustris TaxID=103762 RepID=A0A8J5RZR2_ZIZPA|nr:hypothetical protein GUJ93_ZPchr0002g26802 [Zizania palustris]
MGIGGLDGATSSMVHSDGLCSVLRPAIEVGLSLFGGESDGPGLRSDEGFNLEDILSILESVASYPGFDS